jgi:putative ABC transport system substrate-binding protein
VRRREFIALAGGAAAWPHAARAQQSATPVIGYLGGGSPGPFAPCAAAFREDLKDAGSVVGPNVAIEYCWAEEVFFTARVA